MYFLKGFVEVAGFASNVPGTVAKIGELSSISRTYAKEVGYYDNATYTDIQLLSFTSRQDDSLVEIPDDVKIQTFDVLGWTYGQMIGSNLLEDRTNFLNTLIDQFAGKIEEVDAGLQVSDGNVSIVEWLSWKIVGQESYVRFWFTDESFQTQYDEYEIVVVPPMTNLDNFFRPGAEVEALMSAVNVTTVVNNLQLAKNGYPETIISSEAYNYIDPANPNHKVPTRWGVLIYGAAGNNVDSIKDALVKYVLAHSIHPREDWIELIPDLFKRTEFIITPIWDQYAIPNRTLESGIYSPVITLQRALEIAKLTAPEYPEAHVEANLTTLGHPFKSLTMTSIGGPENREGKFLVTDFYPDYINVSSISPDFNRLSPKTQEWATVIAEMIYLAETAGRYTVMPFGITRLVRNDLLYIVKTMDNVQFLIVAKANFANA